MGDSLAYFLCVHLISYSIGFWMFNVSVRSVFETRLLFFRFMTYCMMSRKLLDAMNAVTAFTYYFIQLRIPIYYVLEAEPQLKYFHSTDESRNETLIAAVANKGSSLVLSAHRECA